MAAARVPLLLFYVEERIEPGRKQQNGSRPGPIVAFFRGRKNRTQAEAAKWQPPGSHCCFLSWKQEWDQGGSNKMTAGGVLLLLSVVEAGMGPGRKQQNGSRPGLIVAFCRRGMNDSSPPCSMTLEIGMTS